MKTSPNNLEPDLISRWQISAGEISAWLPPLLYAAAVLVSAWVFSDARRRGFPFYAVVAWTLATFISTPIFLPLYLVKCIFTPKPRATGTVEQPNATEAVEASTLPLADAQGDDSPAHAPPSGETAEPTVAPTAKHTRTLFPRALLPRTLFPRTLSLPLLYALVLLSVGAIYFYRDYHSFDAHLARAANARLLNQRAAAIREYRAALRLSDDAHTRKLLAVQLAEDGQTAAALSELRAAERLCEPDALLPYRIAQMLDALGRPAEAVVEYQKFTQGSLCAHSSPDVRCAEALARVQQR